MAINIRHMLGTMFLTAASFAAYASNGQAQDLQSLALASDEGRQQRLIEGAKKEGSLTFYTTTPSEYVSLLVRPFEKKYGIKVNVWRARSELILQRVLNETRANKPSSDVVASISPPMEVLRRRDILQEVNSPNQKDLIPTAAPEHRQWISTLQYVFVQAYNTNKIDKEDLPKTYEDLLAPKWKGQLGIEGSDHEWMSSVIEDMGEAAGTQFFKDLIAGNGLSVRNGHPLLTNLAASGEVPLALTVYQYSAAQAKAKGAPIDWFAIEPAVTIADAMGIPKNAPHPHAALLFYDYMISPEAQAILAEIGYYTTSRKIEPVIKDIKLKLLDAGRLLDNQEESFARFESILQLNRQSQ